jgi:hypothetical protein
MVRKSPQYTFIPNTNFRGSDLIINASILYQDNNWLECTIMHGLHIFLSATLSSVSLSAVTHAQKHGFVSAWIELKDSAKHTAYDVIIKTSLIMYLRNIPLQI